MQAYRRWTQRALCAGVGLSFLLGVRPALAGPGDVGSPECGGLHWSLQKTLGNDTRPAYGAGGAYEQAAWNRVGAAMQAGQITGACSECIIKQFYARVPIAAQRPCGPFPTPTPTPEPEPTETPSVPGAEQTPAAETAPEDEEDEADEDDWSEEVDLFEEVPLYEE